MELQRTSDEMERTDGNCVDDRVVKQSTSAKSTAMACKKEEIIFFLLFCVFFFLISSFSRAATRVTHYMIASSKTHMNAQSKC